MGPTVRESSSAPMLWACTDHTCGSRKAPEQSLGGQRRVAPLSLRVCHLSQAQQWCESMPKGGCHPWAHNNQGALGSRPQRSTETPDRRVTLQFVSEDQCAEGAVTCGQDGSCCPVLFRLLTTGPSSCHLPPFPSHISTGVSLLHPLFCKGTQETEKRQQAVRPGQNQDTRMASGQFQTWACHYKLPAKISDIEDNPTGNLTQQQCVNVLPMPTQPLRGVAEACCHLGYEEPAVKPARSQGSSPKLAVRNRAAMIGWNELSRSQNHIMEWCGSEGSLMEI